METCWVRSCCSITSIYSVDFWIHTQERENNATFPYISWLNREQHFHSVWNLVSIVGVHCSAFKAFLPLSFDLSTPIYVSPEKSQKVCVCSWGLQHFTHAQRVRKVLGFVFEEGLNCDCLLAHSGTSMRGMMCYGHLHGKLRNSITALATQA